MEHALIGTQRYLKQELKPEEARAKVDQHK